MDIKEEPLDPLQEDTNLLPTKKELISVGIQTEEQPSPSPPPFYEEWSEGVRRSVWQPGYLPQPEPTGTNYSLKTKVNLYSNLFRMDPNGFCGTMDNILKNLQK